MVIYLSYFNKDRKKQIKIIKYSLLFPLFSRNSGVIAGSVVANQIGSLCLPGLPGYWRILQSLYDDERVKNSVWFRNPFGPQKLPAGSAKFPGRFPAVRHREFSFKPLLQFHKLDANRRRF
jgi:hypothetical protein